MKDQKIFILTPKLKVRFENNKSVIYVNDRPFNHCKYILLINPQQKENQQIIDSIDEAKATLGSHLEKDFMPKDLGITPEQEFWAHCSNLQTWVENDYDTRLLHSNLAFPLLKALSEAGDRNAKRIFKEEITKRILGDYIPIKRFLIEEHYFTPFNNEEIKSILDKYWDNIKKLKSFEKIKRELEILVFFGLKYLDLKYHNDVVDIYRDLLDSKIEMNLSILKDLDLNYKFISDLKILNFLLNLSKLTLTNNPISIQKIQRIYDQK